MLLVLPYPGRCAFMWMIQNGLMMRGGRHQVWGAPAIIMGDASPISIAGVLLGWDGMGVGEISSDAVRLRVGWGEISSDAVWLRVVR